MTGPRQAGLVCIAVLLALAALVRWQFVSAFIADGDDALFALMAKHISEGRDFPLYVWQAHYSGTLSLYPVAALFRLFGPSAWAYNVVGVALSLFWVGLTLLLARRWLGRSGSCACLALAAVPPLGVLSRSLILCGWAETMVLGTAMFWVLTRWTQPASVRSAGWYFALGLICGLGQWISPGYTFLTLTALTVVWLVEGRDFFPRRCAWFALGALAGYLPALVYALQYPGASAMRLAGRILNLDRSLLAAKHPLPVVVRQIGWRLGTVPESLARMPALISQLMGVLTAVAFGAAFSALCFRQVRLFFQERRMTVGMFVIVAAAWFALIYSFLVGENAARYMHPLYLVFVLCAGWSFSILWQRWKAACLSLLVLLVTAHMYSIAYPARRADASSWRQLVNWLESNKLTRGYADYWAGYPVVFASSERVIVSPTLFHPDNSDRYPEYTRQVRSAENVFLLVDTRLYPQAARQIEARLREEGIEFVFFQIQRFALFYDFSQRVTPALFKFNVH